MVNYAPAILLAALMCAVIVGAYPTMALIRKRYYSKNGRTFWTRPITEEEIAESLEHNYDEYAMHTVPRAVNHAVDYMR